MWHRIEPLADDRWDTLVAHHPRASVFHTRAWLEALQRTYGYTPIAYTTSPSGTRLQNGVLFCDVKTWLTRRRLVSLPFSDHCDPLVSNAEWDDFTSQVERLAAEERAHYVEFRPLLGGSDMTAAPPHQTFWFHQIDLRPRLQVLFDNLHKDSIRRKIRRAERDGVICQTGVSESSLNDFWNLFLLMRRRHAAPPPPKCWFRNVLASFGPAAAVRVAYHGNHPIAAIITLCCNNTVVYKYGCSDPAHNNLGGMPLLLWTALQEAKQDGVAVFDLGRSDYSATGLIQFKDRWGTSKSLLKYYRVPASRKDASTAAYPSWTKRLTRHIISSLPHRMFCATGSVLYKHIG